jgi:PAS domain S-box-containing protein
MSITQAARLLNVHNVTLRRWDQAGILKPVRTTREGWRRYRKDDVLALLNKATPASSLRQLSSIELLNRMARLLYSVSASLNSKELAQTVVEQAVELLAATRCAIYLLDESGTLLEPFVAVDREDPQSVEQLFYPNPVPVSAQPLFSLLLNGSEPVWVSDTYADQRTTRQFFEKFVTRALLAVPLRTRNGQTFGFLGFFWTHHPRLFAEEEIVFARALAGQTAINLENSRLHETLQAYTARLETILASAAQGIMVYDADSRIVYANEQLGQLYGMKPEEIVGLYSTELAEKLKPHLEQPEEAAAVVARVERPTSEVYTEEFRLLTPYPRTLRRMVAPVKDAAGTYLGKIALYQDLTEERAIAQAKDDFIRVAAHELKTPLTVLSGYAQLLLQRLARQQTTGALNNEEQENLNRNLAVAQQLQEQALRLKDMIGDLLDVTRLGSDQPPALKLRNLDFLALVQRSVEQLGSTTSQHRFELKVQKDFPRIYQGDSARLEQVVRNLLENAIKYSPQGGLVEVELGWQAKTEEQPGYLRLKVRDQGIGIAKEQQKLLFNRFYRTPSAQKVATGLGLGLALCAEIARQHGGQLEVESEGENKGSTFSLTLPL